MKHIFYIDELERLNIKKDSSLFWAITLLKNNHEVYLLFDKDLSLKNKSSQLLKCYEFNGDIGSDFYISDFKLGSKNQIELNADCLYFRIDPPVDADYLRSAWMINELARLSGSRVTNSPSPTVFLNEKIIAFEQSNSLSTLISSDLDEACEFIQEQEGEYFIIKPLNGYSGIGVKRFKREDFINKDEELVSRFKEKEKLIIQTFDEQIYSGEMRSVFWKAKEIGSMLKVPKEGSYLSNIAQGGSFQVKNLDEKLLKQCEEICKDLLELGVELVAFDILGENISEVNITCPGLLVELSHVHKKNLSKLLT